MNQQEIKIITIKICYITELHSDNLYYLKCIISNTI